MEETCIIVIYYILPKVTAPKKLWQDKNKVIMKEMCTQMDQAFRHTFPEASSRQWVGKVLD